MSDLLPRLRKFTESLAVNLPSAKAAIQAGLPPEFKLKDCASTKFEPGEVGAFQLLAAREDGSFWGVRVADMGGSLRCKFFSKAKGTPATYKLFYDQNVAVEGVIAFAKGGPLPEGQVINDESVDATGEPKPQRMSESVAILTAGAPGTGDLAKLRSTYPSYTVVNLATQDPATLPQGNLIVEEADRPYSPASWAALIARKNAGGNLVLLARNPSALPDEFKA